MSDEKTIHQLNKYRTVGTAWVVQQQFWFFGTLKFIDGEQIRDAQAIQDCSYFFNKLDRRILGSTAVQRKGQRLSRLVFMEHGKTGNNTHFHFFIKGKTQAHFRQILKAASDIWHSQKMARTLDLRLEDNLGNEEGRAYYGWKEMRTFEKETLVPTLCHLSQ